MATIVILFLTPCCSPVQYTLVCNRQWPSEPVVADPTPAYYKNDRPTPTLRPGDCRSDARAVTGWQ